MVQVLAGMGRKGKKKKKKSSRVFLHSSDDAQRFFFFFLSYSTRTRQVLFLNSNYIRGRRFVAFFFFFLRVVNSQHSQTWSCVCALLKRCRNGVVDPSKLSVNED